MTLMFLIQHPTPLTLFLRFSFGNKTFNPVIRMTLTLALHMRPHFGLIVWRDGVVISCKKKERPCEPTIQG